MNRWVIVRKIMGRDFYWRSREALPWTTKLENAQVWMTEAEVKATKKRRAIKGKVVKLEEE